uniref:Cysteine proteinase inhibitor n=1 Tax=Oryza glumipatula TaxID=40148 RepID=A0A0D9YQE9_9ORYZ
MSRKLFHLTRLSKSAIMAQQVSISGQEDFTPQQLADTNTAKIDFPRRLECQLLSLELKRSDDEKLSGYGGDRAVPPRRRRRWRRRAGRRCRVASGGDVIRGDGFYRQVARFALVVRMLAFGAAEGELTLVEVVAGSVQAAGAGSNYRLVLRAAGGGGNGGVGTYEAVVWGVPGSTAWTWKVLSFRRVAGD